MPGVSGIHNLQDSLEILVCIIFAPCMNTASSSFFPLGDVLALEGLSEVERLVVRLPFDGNDSLPPAHDDVSINGMEQEPGNFFAVPTPISVGNEFISIVRILVENPHHQTSELVDLFELPVLLPAGLMVDLAISAYHRVVLDVFDGKSFTAARALVAFARNSVATHSEADSFLCVSFPH